MPQFEFTIPDECLSQSDPWPKVNVCYRVYNDSSISVSVGMESHIMAILTNTHKLKRLIDEAAEKDALSRKVPKKMTTQQSINNQAGLAGRNTAIISGNKTSGLALNQTT